MEAAGEEHNAKRLTNPTDRANLLSRLFFWTELEMVVKRWRQELHESDIFAPRRQHESKRLGDKLEAAWFGEVNFRERPSLRRAIVGVFGLEFFLYGILYFPLHVAVALLQPYFLSLLLDYYVPRKSETTLQEAYLYAFLLTAVSFLDVLSFHYFNMALLTLGMKIRIACSSLIYRRCLKFKKMTFRKVKIGQVINLLSNDVKRFDTAFVLLHYVWIGPFELAIAAYYLAKTLGGTALAGIFILCITILLQLSLSKKITARRKSVALSTDHRMCFMNDVITNIKLIKINTWEKTFSKLVANARNYEIKELKKANRLRLANSTFKLFLTEMCSYFCVLAAVCGGMRLSSEFVFVLRTTFENIKTPVVTNLPEAVTNFAEVQMSIRRLEEFLTWDYEKAAILSVTDNIANNCVPKSLILFIEDAPSIVGHDISIENVLTKAKFSVILGDLVGITGASGSGKTTLLQTLLKEVELSEGVLHVNGAISYACQDPWIFPSSIKQNILFGQKFDEEKYERVIEVCGLEHDLSVLPLKDNTLVGERGVMLSSSQKTRIHLARAIYKDADIYLLDDLLSAIESIVVKKIFTSVTTYLKNKCVLIVTNQISCLQNVGKIFHLKKGRLITITKHRICKFEKDYFREVSLDPVRDGRVSNETQPLKSSEKSSFKILKHYCDCGGGNFAISRLFLTFFLVQILLSLSDCFITFWVELEEEPIKFQWLSVSLNTQRCLCIYTLILSFLIVATAISTWSFVDFCSNASKNLHDTVFQKILYGTMTFFNTNSSGKILNCFSKDFGAIDETAPFNMKAGIEMLLNIGAIGLIISIINYYMTLPTVLLFIICLVYNQVFDKKSLTKLEASTQSPVYTHLAATMQGMSTIRTCNVQKILQKEFDRHQDLHTSAFYMSMATSSAFNFWSDLTRVIYTGLAIFSFFFVRSYVADVGLAITQAMQFTVIQRAVNAWNNVLNDIISVERVIEYSELPTEPAISSDVSEWPRSGKVEFRNVSMKYSCDGPTVLKRISFVIESGEKIGILGNNASGKSSLISVLFRLFHFEGTVLIDEMDTKSLSLNVLRSKIFMIPHKPLLLQGSLRQNLDPLGEFTDFSIWLALEEVALHDVVYKLPERLYTQVSEDSPSFSVMQKPLLYLARAILKQAKILVIFRSLFNFDSKRDKLVQTVLKRHFGKCTVLVVALNLKSVMDLDRVLVLNDGCVVKFCKPAKLQQMDTKCACQC